MCGTGFRLLTGGHAVGFPLGALIVLERHDSPRDPVPGPIPADQALAALITQNFARGVHGAAFLSSAEALTKGFPAYRLSYFCAEQAAA